LKIEIPKPLIWIGSSKKELLNFPETVKQTIGYALYLAQKGEKHQDSKPLKGFGGAKTLEVVEDFKGDPFIPLNWITLFMYSIVFRKNQRQV